MFRESGAAGRAKGRNIVHGTETKTEIKLLYFAWLRGKVGASEETLALPDSVTDVAGLIDWLKQQSPGHAEAFADESVVGCAVNHEFAQGTDPVRPGDEIAFFPPVTGG